MAGVTDTAYCILAQRMGCGLVYSEMVSDQGINFRNERTLEMLKTVPEQRPLAIQLFSGNPERMYKAASFVASLNCCDMIDINMGCPAPKIVRNNEGSALMKDPVLAYEIMCATREAVKDMPVTVKCVRAGIVNTVMSLRWLVLLKRLGLMLLLFMAELGKSFIVVMLIGILFAKLNRLLIFLLLAMVMLELARI